MPTDTKAQKSFIISIAIALIASIILLTQFLYNFDSKYGILPAIPALLTLIYLLLLGISAANSSLFSKPKEEYPVFRYFAIIGLLLAIFYIPYHHPIIFYLAVAFTGSVPYGFIKHMTSSNLTRSRL